MKAGTVTTIRINPRDSQSILDVLDAAGVPRQSLSFAQCVSLALGSLLETARQNGLIPEPDEFAYLERLSPYIGPVRQKRKTKIANALHDMGGSMRAPVIREEPARGPRQRWQDSPDAEETQPKAEVDEDSVEVKEARSKLTHLLMAKEMKEDEGTWSAEDDANFQAVYRIVYPHG